MLCICQAKSRALQYAPDHELLAINRNEMHTQEGSAGIYFIFHSLNNLNQCALIHSASRKNVAHRTAQKNKAPED